jgi:hypothetical protein
MPRTIDQWRTVLAGVPALTVRNPWAHYIARCGKNIENRSWLPPAGVTRILIHAGVGWDRDLNPVRVPGLAADVPRAGVRSIVALATIGRVCSASVDTATLVCRCGEWALVGQHHWHLTDVIALPDPVPYQRGRLKLWTVDPVAVHAIAAQLALAA